MRFSCDHCGRVYAVSDELSGRTFRMKCKACGEAILVHGKGQSDGHGDEPIGPSPSISVLHAVEPAAIRPAPTPRPPPKAGPEVNPFVAQPITVARVAAAMDGSLAAAAAELAMPLALTPPREPVAVPEEPLAAGAAAGSVDDLCRSLDEELGPDGTSEIEEFQIAGPPDAQPIGRLREPGARPAAVLAGRRPSDGEGAMALATFTEPAVAGVRPARAPLGQDLGGRPVPQAIQEFEAPSPPETPRPRQPLLLVGLGLALAVGLAVGLFLARRGGEHQGVPGPVAAPAPSPAPVETPAEVARAVPLEAVATPRPTPMPPTQAKPADPADGPKPADAAERVAPRKGVRARRQEAAPATPAAEGVVPRGGLLDDEGPRAPAAGEGKQPAVPKAAAPVAPTALEPVAATAREPAPDAPRYLASGFRSPRLAQADCLSENLRLPPQLAEMVAGPVTVKFAVYPDGRVDQLQVMNKLPDPRIGEAVARAVRACEWVPGADADGTPTPLWVVQPLRFAP